MNGSLNSSMHSDGDSLMNITHNVQSTHGLLPSTYNGDPAHADLYTKSGKLRKNALAGGAGKGRKGGKAQDMSGLDQSVMDVEEEEVLFSQHNHEEPQGDNFSLSHSLHFLSTLVVPTILYL